MGPCPPGKPTTVRSAGGLAVGMFSAGNAGISDRRMRVHVRRADASIGAPLVDHVAMSMSIGGNVAVTQAFLKLFEVIGHADLLVNEGRVREVDDGEVIGYEAIK
jgi:hypothetical protein